VIGYGNTAAEQLTPAVRVLAELAAGIEKPRRRRA
jgi:GntR family transcriptional regulator/MocR family aminotransferase